MRVIDQWIQVRYRHRIFFTRHLFGLTNTLLHELITEDHPPQAPKVLVVLDESLHLAQPGLLRSVENYFARFGAALVCPPVLLEGGERVKNSYFHVSQVQSRMDRYHIDRHSYVLGVGGGALLDVVGLAAATAHRGVRHIRIPSTTLSQNDSGVGVKNGINAFGKKNFIGSFAVPFAVVNDFELLTSLPSRDKRCGYIEAVKVALIRDQGFFEALVRDASRLKAFDPVAMERLIVRCAELHVQHIAQGGDPFETGSARPLDFGHWSAHKLEQLSEYRLRHGEAVAVGIALDVLYSRNKGYLDPASAERVLQLIEKLGFEIFANELLHVDSENNLLVLRGLQEFQEHLGGQLTVTLLHGIGQGCEVHTIDRDTMRSAIEELHHRHLAKTRATSSYQNKVIPLVGGH